MKKVTILLVVLLAIVSPVLVARARLSGAAAPSEACVAAASAQRDALSQAALSTQGTTMGNALTLGVAQARAVLLQASRQVSPAAKEIASGLAAFKSAIPLHDKKARAKAVTAALGTLLDAQARVAGATDLNLSAVSDLKLAQAGARAANTDSTAQAKLSTRLRALDATLARCPGSGTALGKGAARAAAAAAALAQTTGRTLTTLRSQEAALAAAIAKDMPALNAALKYARTHLPAKGA